VPNVVAEAIAASFYFSASRLRYVVEVEEGSLS